MYCKTHYFKRFHEEGSYLGGDKFENKNPRDVKEGTSSDDLISQDKVVSPDEATSPPVGTSSITSEEELSDPVAPAPPMTDDIGIKLEEVALTDNSGLVKRQVTPVFDECESVEDLGPGLPPTEDMIENLARLVTPQGSLDCQVCIAMGATCISCQGTGE